jgi:3-hydroxybutyryl-CoA dehydrogenase
MATGIAEVFAKAGCPVTLVARSAEKAERARAALAASLDRQVSRGRLDAGRRDRALALVTAADSAAALAGADLVVEAVAEDLAVKRRLFAELDAVCRPGAVLATTTSSLPVVEIAAATKRPADVVGMHFFNPAPVMRLVEVVRTVLTSDDTHATVRAVCARVGKHAVDCGDRAGFIVNALLFPYLNSAVRMVEENYASVEDVDAAMRLGGGYPMGPFELLDVVGLDVSLAIERVLHREFRDPGLAPAPLLEHLVSAGCLGRKTGRGFRAHARR